MWQQVVCRYADGGNGQHETGLFGYYGIPAQERLPGKGEKGVDGMPRFETTERGGLMEQCFLNGSPYVPDTNYFYLGRFG